jgi:hypothetical protein
MLRSSKDAALGIALRVFLNARVKAIGEVTALSLDTDQRRARLSVTLRGEPDVVELDVRRYALDDVDGQSWLTLLEATASREWVEALLQNLAVGRRFRVSPHAAKALRLLTS